MADWFRKTTWGPDDERDFRARLSRARRRTEYLRIQAFHLLDSGLPAPALGLLDELLAIDPDDLFLSWIHSARAQALRDLGRPDQAIEAFRAALHAAHARPTVLGYAGLEFAEFVVAARRPDLFQEALAALDEMPADDPFPVVHYRAAAVRALIADERGDRNSARMFASKALEAAVIATAPFPRHPGVGLVRNIDPSVHARLRALCAA